MSDETLKPPTLAQASVDTVTQGSDSNEVSARAKNTRRVKPKKPAASDKKTKAKKVRTQRTFPASSFEEALGFAKAIVDFGSGQPVRRLGIFHEIGKSPESGQSRMMVTNANKYGLIEGSYTAEMLKPTESGLRAVSEEVAQPDRMRVRAKLAIDDIPVFKNLYERYVGNKLPARAALVDAAHSFGVGDDVAEEAIDTFVVNLRFLGLLQTLSGAERIITLDHLIETLPRDEVAVGKIEQGAGLLGTASTIVSLGRTPLDRICFYVAPIGDEGSETRKHSDVLLGSIVEPALEQFKLEVVRADSISQPGLIGKQIIEYIFGSRLVVVDLSFHNPNVFYELAIRHMLRKPIVQIMRKANNIPFDINQQRTIIVDTTDIYSFVPKIETYRAEVATQARHALESADSADNPISFVYPSLKIATG